jgi:hypothetical protein
MFDTDLGHKHRPQCWSDAGNGLDRLEAAVWLELGGQPLGHDVDLEREGVDQPAKREHPGLKRRVQSPLVEQLGPGHTEQVRHRDLHALLGQHGVHLGLEPGT